MIRLDDLLGLAWSRVHRSLDLQGFQFGVLRERRSIGGRIARVGELALHVQCPWRVVDEGGLLVESELHEPGRTRNDAELARLVARGLTVTRTTRDERGSLRITLTSGLAIEVMPEAEATEQWRLFAPGHIDREPIVYPP